MKFISWNVNGLRACDGKGFREIFANLDADFFCLQETKMQPGQLDIAFDGYQSYWNSAEKKGYSGTAIFTRHEPLRVAYGLGIEEHDKEGRVITLEMDNFFLVTVYTPNSQDGLRRLDYRMEWDDAFRDYLKKLDAEKPVVVCGDMNVAHQEIDLKTPRLIAGMPDLPTRNAKNSAVCSVTDLPIRSAFLSRPNRYLFVVVVSLQGTRKEHGVAYRLLPGVRQTSAPVDRS